ncbi:hypothetical protein AURDEDRAFT_182132 [Auricularia subglabra TFB-10046 SS5]|nr:hypothetical protein AURDEDRAFT_182132 [Auricularia subglabra TFB-10046 SS5]
MSSRATARAARPAAAQLSAASVPGIVLSFLALPKDALVLCSSYAPLGDPATHCHSIEHARRHLLHDRRQPSLVDSLLAHVDSSSHDTRFWVFAVASRATQPSRAHALASLALHNLIAVDSASFDFRQLYSSNSQSPAFVTPGLHRLYLMFLAALRSRILADICDNVPDRVRASHVRMRDGFLLVPRPVNSEWSVGWDDPQRRLAYCHLHLHWMNASTIVLRPVFSTSQYSQLSPKHCPAGQPVALLPYAVPAYFIAPYTGSTAALSQHFRDSLAGLGVGPTWESQGYILCWIAVHNSQGDDKAVLAVWPAALAVACPDRPLADRLPTVPDHFAPAVSASVAERSFAAPRAQRGLPVVVRQAGDLPRVANTVANFIDALAKERERERERAKEERYRRLQVSVPQPGSAGPRSTMSGSAGAYPLPGSASEHFPSPAIPLNTFTSPPQDASALPQQSLAAAWGAPAQLDGTSVAPASTSLVDDFYSSFNLVPDMGDLGFTNLLTDEDFDFFDQPAVQIPPAEPPPAANLDGMGDIEMADLGINLNLDIGALDLGQALDPHSHDGMGMPLYGTGWTPEYAPDPPRADSFEPNLLDGLPSPAKTPWAPPLPEPEPPTADLVFSRDPNPLSYDEVPFAQAHNLADAKYSAGKFAPPLLSPAPSDEDGGGATLRERYGTLTNPRVGVVRRLKFAKRKSIDQGHRPSPSPWERGEPEWVTYPPSSPEALPSPPSSDAEDSEDDNDRGAGLFGDYDECDAAEDVAMAREPTPVPDAVLIGPSLLHASFAHRALVQLGVPFPAPTAASAAGAQPMSVPTPVSPAAAGAGATPFERARNLEPVAGAFAREVVENATWAAAWRLLDEQKDRPVWREEIDQGIDALNKLPYLALAPHNGLAMKPLPPPRITMEKGGNLIQIIPSALRFWEKLGLGPRGGKKHVSAFVLYEDGSEASSHIPSWMEMMSKFFSARGFGTHSTGTAVGHDNGLVPLKWELFRKTLSNVVVTMTTPTTPTHYAVFYVLVPNAMMTMSSTFLRNILGVAAQHLKLPGGVAFDPDRMLIHLLPEAALLDQSLFPVGPVASSVYDRLPRIAERHGARAFFKRGLAWRAAFDAAAFTLARNPAQTKVDLRWDWPIEHLDVLDKHTLLHIAYRISRCGHWVLFAATDGRGESHSLGTWAHSPECTSAELVQEVWKRTMDLVAKTNVEWRIVVAKSGTIGREELAAWTSLWDKVFSDENPPSCQVILAAVHNAAPFTLVPQSLSHTLRPGGAATMAEERPTATSFLSDVFWQGFVLGPVGMQPLSVVADEPAAVPEWSVREDPHVASHSDTGVIPMASVSLLRAPSQPSRLSMCHVHLFHLANCTEEEDATALLASIADNYSDLAVLGRVRAYGISSETPVLALHIAALDRMDSTLSVSDLAAEVVGTIVEQTS